LRQNQQAGLQQLFRQAIQGDGEFIGDGANGHSQDAGSFDLSVFLKDDPAEHHAIERAQPIETFFDIEHEDHSVLEGTDGRLEHHPRAMGSPRMLGALPTCIDA